MTFADSHNHLQRFADPPAIIKAMREAGVGICVVNGTSEADWPKVADLAEQHPDFVRPAFGLHPWMAANRTSGWLRHLEGWLDRFPLASLGECGLDGWVDQPVLAVQREVFLPQIAIARERNLPLTIHALKAWQPLIDALAAEPPPERGFLLHSFGGSAELVRRFADLGAYFSFSGYFLHPKKTKVLDAYKAVPSDRLLLETDAPDMLPPDSHMTHPLPDGRNHPANLPQIASGLAKALELSVEELRRNTRLNHERFFGIAE